MGGRGDVGWPNPGDVLGLVPTWDDATSGMLAALVTMSDPGRRLKAAQRLQDVADRVRRDPDGWDGDGWRRTSGLGPAARAWIDVLTGGGGMVASTSVLRTAARITATEVDRQNRLSHGRMELAGLIGDGDSAAVVNAALHRLGTKVCTAEEPDCTRCPVAKLCRSAR
jgi:DNA (cytosine-5)-methyltransferase 1